MSCSALLTHLGDRLHIRLVNVLVELLGVDNRKHDLVQLTKLRERGRGRGEIMQIVSILSLLVSDSIFTALSRSAARPRTML